MKWLENNPVSVALLSFCGLMVLISAILILAWNRPVTPALDAGDEAMYGDGQSVVLTTELGPLSDYREVTDRPVFDESRRPSVSLDDSGGLSMDATSTMVADAPDVRLTGVVITPDRKIVTLTPNSGGEPLIFSEGLDMEGEYSGWTVSKVDSRKVALESYDGDVIELDLLVHKQEIEAPPEPPPPAPGKVVDSDAALRAQEDAEPLSRAEEIRQRIAERREELRREQEENAKPGRQEQQSAYQNAIRNMMKSRNNDENKDDSGG